MPDFLTPLTAPVLAVHAGIGAVRAVLHLPTPLGHERHTFTLPSPDAALARNIDQATADGCAVHVSGHALGHLPARSMRAHLEAGLALSLHPASAALLCAGRAPARACGLLIRESPPPGARALQGAGFAPALWETACAMTGLPRPERMLVASLEAGCLFSENNVPPRAALIHALFAGAGPRGPHVRDFFRIPPGPGGLRLSLIRRMTGTAALDSAAAFVLGMLAVPDIRSRSQRQGVALLYAGRLSVCAALIFQARLVAYFELPLESALPVQANGARDVSGFMGRMREFCLGWLPHETALALGGFVCAALPLPPEAEGFAPLYVAGPAASLFQGVARIVEEESGGPLRPCLGLLHGYAVSLGAC